MGGGCGQWNMSPCGEPVPLCKDLVVLVLLEFCNSRCLHGFWDTHKEQITASRPILQALQLLNDILVGFILRLFCGLCLVQLIFYIREPVLGFI